MGATTNKEYQQQNHHIRTDSNQGDWGGGLDIFFWPNIYPAVVKTQILISSHGGFVACANLESSFNKSVEKC